jgi:uncharacterized membrane protein
MNCYINDVLINGLFFLILLLFFVLGLYIGSISTKKQIYTNIKEKKRDKRKHKAFYSI